MIVNIGLFGPGTVGSGVIEILNTNRDKFLAIYGIRFKLAKIYVRNFEKYSKILDPTILVNDIDDILEDSNINVIIETMGGIELANNIILKAIEKGKHVITANKDLLAHRLTHYLELCKNNNTNIGIEASVCGGIPIINTIFNSLPGDSIASISGIMNGTTNYILSNMEDNNVSFSEILKKAQDLGFAEANPSSDIDGYDIRYKIAILVKVCYGLDVDQSKIWCQGIRKITKKDFEYADMMKCSIKMIATAQKINNKLKITVTPTVIDKKYTEATIKGATNLVNIKSNNLVESILVGKGAGKLPTANSVINDLIGIYSGNSYSKNISSNQFSLINDWSEKFYIRFRSKDRVGLVHTIGKLCEQNQISIHSLLQNPIENPDDIVFIVITEKCCITNIEQFKCDIRDENILLEDIFFMPIIN